MLYLTSCVLFLCRYGASTIQSVVLRASIAASTGNFEKSDDILLTEKKRLESIGTENHDDAVEKIVVVYVQTLIARQRYSDALTFLDDINSLKYTAAGVSAVYYLKALELKSQDQNKQNVKQILSKVASEYLVEVAASLDECSDAEYSAANGTQTLLFIAQVLEQHQHHRASANALQILLRCGSGDLDAAERLIVTAHLTTALSYHEPAEAERYASSLPPVEFGEFDAHVLETKDVPRVKKHNTGNTSAVAETDSRAQALAARKVKKNLARRAARKAAHLAKLEEQGKYDPVRPSKPDAERYRVFCDVIAYAYRLVLFYVDLSVLYYFCAEFLSLFFSHFVHTLDGFLSNNAHITSVVAKIGANLWVDRDRETGHKKT